MKKYLPTHFIFLLSFFIFSCEGQKKIEQPQEVIYPSQEIIDLPEVDPYFTEDTLITSPYGPHNITRNIIQDRAGNFWLATWEGIIHYDGKIFTNYTYKEGLRRYRVFTILEDKTGKIWFGTVGAGIYLYDPVEKSFTNFTTKEGLIHDGVGSIFEDKAGNIWIGTAKGLSKYRPRSSSSGGKIFTSIRMPEGQNNNDINTIVEDESGKLWLGTRGYAHYYDPTISETEEEAFTQITNDEGAPFVNVRSIIKDTKDNIWLGGNDGLWRYDGNSFTRFTKNFVGYIYEDQQGRFWTSSEAGLEGNARDWVLTRYDESSANATKLKATIVKTEANMFFGIIDDRDGNIWFGSLTGIYRYDGTSFNHFKEQED